MEEKSWSARELSQRLLHKGSTGVFGLHDVELSNGHRLTLELLRHPGAAAVVPFLDERRVVLLRQFRFAAGGPIWEVPAGKLDPGEAPDACAARELIEETGYRAGRIIPTGSILTAPGFTDERIHLFCAHDLSKEATRREPGELMEVHELELDDALAMIERGEIVDAKTIVALVHASRRARSAR